jgi:hypothetical protein
MEAGMPPRKLLPATTQSHQILPAMNVGWNRILLDKIGRVA